jgi:cysteinyl-tRNA synthetase
MIPQAQIRLSNSLTNTKEVLQPIVEGKITLYACGVTVYDRCHLGHAMQAILFDTLVRYLRYRGFEVTYVRNYTDVDDKIINRAKEMGISPLELSEQMIDLSRKDMDALGVQAADHEPRVSAFIPEIISYIQALIDKGFAYSTESGDVYFRVSSKPDYGKLSNQRPEELQSGHRIDLEEDKESPLDFALWKHDSVEGASWPSPWGCGRPGWHIECSVMSSEILGPSFDIHGGGRDLVFPHHENEIAQSEAHSGASYANYWLHTGLLTLEHQKMSKSVGNIMTVEESLARYDVEVIRWNIFQVHYASNLDFNAKNFRLGLTRVYYFYKTLSKAQDFLQVQGVKGGKLPSELDPILHRQAFHESMDDDFNIPKAFTTVNRIFQELNDILVKKGLKAPIKTAIVEAMLTLVQEIGSILGMFQRKPEQFLEMTHHRYLKLRGLEVEFIEKQLHERTLLRKNREYAKSDELREKLHHQGIGILDTPKGQVWELTEDALHQLVTEES